MNLRRIGLSLLCTTAIAAAADDPATLRQAFLNDHRGAIILTENTQVTRVYGDAFGFGGSAEESADRFRRDYAGMFGVSAADLRPGNPTNENLTQPVSYDPSSDSYRFTLVYYRQFFGDIPVFRAEMRMLVRNEPGFPLVWVNPYVRDLGDFSINAATPALKPAHLTHLAQAVIGELKNFTAPRAVIWAGVDDMTVEPRLAVELIGDNGNQAGQDTLKWLFVMDAATGEVLYRENLILEYSEVSGTVQGRATGVCVRFC